MNSLQVIFSGALLAVIGVTVLYVATDTVHEDTFRRAVAIGSGVIGLGCFVIFLGLGMVTP